MCSFLQSSKKMMNEGGKKMSEKEGGDSDIDREREDRN